MATNVKTHSQCIINSYDDNLKLFKVQDDQAGTTLIEMDAKLTSDHSSSAVLSRVSSSASNQTLLASNSNRKGAIFYNNSTQVCYVKLGATASSSSFSIYMEGGSHLILDQSPIYTGQIDGIWALANGTMEITELS